MNIADTQQKEFLVEIGQENPFHKVVYRAQRRLDDYMISHKQKQTEVYRLQGLRDAALKCMEHWSAWYDYHKGKSFVNEDIAKSSLNRWIFAKELIFNEAAFSQVNISTALAVIDWFSANVSEMDEIFVTMHSSQMNGAMVQLIKLYLEDVYPDLDFNFIEDDNMGSVISIDTVSVVSSNEIQVKVTGNFKWSAAVKYSPEEGLALYGPYPESGNRTKVLRFSAMVEHSYPDMRDLKHVASFSDKMSLFTNLHGYINGQTYWLYGPIIEIVNFLRGILMK